MQPAKWCLTNKFWDGKQNRKTNQNSIHFHQCIRVLEILAHLHLKGRRTEENEREPRRRNCKIYMFTCFWRRSEQSSIFASEPDDSGETFERLKHAEIVLLKFFRNSSARWSWYHCNPLKSIEIHEIHWNSMIETAWQFADGTRLRHPVRRVAQTCKSEWIEMRTNAWESHDVFSAIGCLSTLGGPVEEPH